MAFPMSSGTSKSSLDFLAACAKIMEHSTYRCSKHALVLSSADPSKPNLARSFVSISQQSITGETVFEAP